MDKKNIRILLIEDDEGDADLIREMLSGQIGTYINIEWVNNLYKGIESVGKGNIDLILLDLNLPDSQGFDTFLKMQSDVIKIPIIVFTGYKDETLGYKAVRAGAQDYLIKGNVDEHLLLRSIQYAVERHQLHQQLEEMRRKEQEAREQAELLRNNQHYQAMSLNKIVDEKGGICSPSAEKLFDFMQDYRDVIIHYVRAVRIREERPVEKVRILAQKLIEINVCAADVIKLHLKSLNEFLARALAQEKIEFSNDARLALVELMGTMADQYREKYHVSVSGRALKE